MEEVLTNTDDPEVPLKDREFYALVISDGDEIRGPGFFVRQLHAAWSEVRGMIAWDRFEIEELGSYTEAQELYEARRAALHRIGFIYSDREL
jgi:hypothetical protein